MTELSDTRPEQQERKLEKLEKNQAGMIEEWINEKNKWDRLKWNLKN
jgi:hypothetical protein